jgi:preprotein translocase subunit SecB
MNFFFKGLTVEELSYTFNKIKFDPNSKFEIKPQFSRQLRKANDTTYLVNLSVSIKSTEQEPKPFDLAVSLVGIFDVQGVTNAQQERDFVIEATRQMYPYLRSHVTTLTATALIAPLTLPTINGPLFPEDKDVYAFSAGGNGLN